MGAFDDIKKGGGIWKAAAGESAFFSSGFKVKPVAAAEVSNPDDPTTDMSTYELFGAGLGKRGRDILTMGTAEQRPYDKLLMNHGAAQAGAGVADLAAMLAGGRILGAFGGLVGKAAPTVGKAISTVGDTLAVPNTAVRAGLGGGAYAAATTPGSLADRAISGGIAGTVGAVLPVSGAAGKGTGALLEPLTEAGQNRIAGRTLSYFAGNDPAVLSRLSNPDKFVSGSLPTAADAAGNKGIASLQQSLSHVDPGGFGNALSDRLAANKLARLNALRGIAQDDTARAAAVDARSNAVEPLYDAAKSAVVPVDSALDGLLTRPIVQDGAAFAARNAGNRGQNFMLSTGTTAQTVSSGLLDSSGSAITHQLPAVPATISGNTLHELKVGIDQAIKQDPKTSAARIASSSELEGRDAFLNWLESKIPEYGIAKSEFSRLSKPIGQMDVGKELLDKLQPALNDFGSTREAVNTFALALRNADKTAQKATGFLGTTLENTMTPDQMATITGVGKDLARKANTEDLIKSVGSNTAQNLASQNVLRQIFGPLGLPQSWAEATVPQTLLKPLNMIYGGIAEPKIATALGDALLNPELAALLMQQRQKGKVSGLLGGVLDAFPALGIAAGINQ